MKMFIFSILGILFVFQANAAYEIRQKIIKQSSFDTKIAPSEFKMDCWEDEFWQEGDLTLNWSVPFSHSEKPHNKFTMHNLLSGACPGQLSEIAELSKRDNGLNVTVKFETSLSAVIWADKCSIDHYEFASVRIKDTSYTLSDGDSYKIAEPTPAECLELTKDWTKISYEYEQKAYELASQKLAEKLNVRHPESLFDISHTYKLSRENDQRITFSFDGKYQDCTVEVDDQPLRVISLTCKSNSRNTENMICDKDHYHLFQVNSGVTSLKGNFETKFTEQTTKLTFSSYGADNFEDVIFADKDMKTAIYVHGLLWPYGDPVRESITKTELSQTFCK